MWTNPQEAVDLVTFTEENLNKKLLFLRSNFIKSNHAEDFWKTSKLKL